jgi:hypothetical protein
MSATLGFVLALPFMAHAQDAGGSVNDLFGFIWDFIPAKYKSIALTVLTGLYLFEQFLAATTKIKENSTFQIVAKWVATVYAAIKKKVSN